MATTTKNGISERPTEINTENEKEMANLKRNWK